LDDAGSGDASGDAAHTLLKRLLSTRNRVAPGASGGVYTPDDGDDRDDANAEGANTDAGGAGQSPGNAMKKMFEALQRSGVQVEWLGEVGANEDKDENSDEEYSR